MLVTFVLGLLAMGPAGSPEGSNGTIQAESSCCYTHPSFTGVCSVEPAEDETCASILAYLNNPMADGKNYCGGTKIRGGWKRVACE